MIGTPGEIQMQADHPHPAFPHREHLGERRLGVRHTPSVFRRATHPTRSRRGSGTTWSATGVTDGRNRNPLPYSLPGYDITVR